MDIVPKFVLVELRLIVEISSSSLSHGISIVIRKKTLINTKYMGDEDDNGSYNNAMWWRENCI